ncbi:MAG: amidase [Actinomycetota bacterium]
MEDAVFIRKLASAGPGRAVAVKDLIDMAGLPTIAGCEALAGAAPAGDDAACLAGIRAAEAAGELHIVGKTNLHELAFGITGINRWSGTPVNPTDPRRVPGGSSSGSAVAVALGLAEMALGTDTGGSIRIPAACCGVAGLKTTHGRIDMTGIRPLAKSLDTVGPMAANVAGLVWGMELLEPGFSLEGVTPPKTAGRLRLAANPLIDEAIDRVLAESGVEVVDVDLPGWDQTAADTMAVIAAEAFDVNGYLLATSKLGADVAERLQGGSRVVAEERRRLEAARVSWKLQLGEVLARVGVIVAPVLTDFAPLLEEPERMYSIRQAHPVNFAGVPALALPVPTGGPLPAGLHLIGPAGSEELLLATGLVLEAAAMATAL